MDQHALNVLEYPKIQQYLREYAVSSLGKKAVDELQPLIYEHAIQEALAETSEMARLYEMNQGPPLDGIYDVTEPVTRSQTGGTILEPAEAYLVGETIYAARRLRDALRAVKQPVQRVMRYTERLAVLPEIEEALERIFDRHNEVRDAATKTLSRIRRDIRQLRGNIVSRLERMIRGKYADYLQENYYTFREGRYVLPVDARYQSKVQGIVHDRSATSTTVYIEPMAIISDGNRLKDLQRDEAIEIRHILRGLTETIGQYASEILENLEIFRHIDLLSAKARFALKYEMKAPTVSEQNHLSIQQGYHPLLLIRSGREKVVPLNLEMKQDRHGLVVTGPNTGGKTVVLKTVGLITVMAQSGLMVPASAQTMLPVFRNIGADIGDEQSLEQSLSTFSSHMQNIRHILEQADAHTLVLLDELGSGTDPREGGSLSCAILQHLDSVRSTFLVTTHLQDVKIYAHATEGLVNGAMEFDVQNLSPTFRFRMGLPGQSNAIRIAERLEMPPAVIQQAEKNLGERDESPEDLLARLGNEVKEAERARQRSEAELEQALQMQQDAEHRLERARKEAQNVIQRAERKAQYLIQEFERRLKDLEKQEKEFKRQWQEKLDALLKQSKSQEPPESTLSGLRKGLESAKQQLSGTEPQTPQQPKYQRKPWRWDQIQEGARIRIAGLSEMGRVTRVWPQKKEVEVQVSAMTLRVKESQILAVMGAQKEPAELHPPSVQVERPSGDVSSSVDIHGMTVEEMIPIVQRFLDQAYRRDLPSVTIVHGFGSGTLRREVRRLLSTLPFVHSFQNGMEFEGGAGVTVVNFTGKT